jgi:hypothetical protein
MIIQTFYAGLNFSSRNLLDSAAGGTFMSINLGAATNLLDESGFGVHLGTYSPFDHRWILHMTVGFFRSLTANRRRLHGMHA